MDVESLLESFKKDLDAIKTIRDLESLKSLVLGRKSQTAKAMSLLPTLAVEARKAFGAKINDARKRMEELIESKKVELNRRRSNEVVQNLEIDFNLPGRQSRPLGHFHPLVKTARLIVEALESLGFVLVDSPELESDFYNFEALNMEAGHPARDNQDSFYLSPTRLLRTHTTACDARSLEKMKPPFAVACHGRTFRRDATDATHFPVFHQVDALYVDEGLNFGHLKSLVYEMCARLFDKDVETRFRPDYFPFTEPSCEVAVRSKKMGAASGKWLEILGSGMFHPSILERFGIDSEKYRGIAFGIGVERIAMLKYGVKDIREFFEGDYAFLEQF